MPKTLFLHRHLQSAQKSHFPSNLMKFPEGEFEVLSIEQNVKVLCCGLFLIKSYDFFRLNLQMGKTLVFTSTCANRSKITFFGKSYEIIRVLRLKFRLLNVKVLSCESLFVKSDDFLSCSFGCPKICFHIDIYKARKNQIFF